MTNKRVSNVVMTIRGLQEQAQKISGDSELSETGKQRRLSEIGAQASRYKAQALRDLREDWSQARKQSAQLEARYKQAQASAASTWNYEQLTYEGLAAQSAIRQAQDFEQVKALYQAAASSGNLARARAWSEIAPGAVLERFSYGDGIEANRLILEMRANLESLTNTPEMAVIVSEKSALAADALELLSASRETGEFYDARNWDIGDFGKLSQGVSVTRKFTDNGGLLTTVEIDEAEPAEQETMSVSERRERLGL